MLPFISIFGIKIPLYGLCIATGLLIAGLLCYLMCKKKNQDFLNFILISTVVLAAGFTGAKLLYILVTYPVKDFFKITLSLLSHKPNAQLAAGFVFYGGLILGVPAYFLGVHLAKCGTFEYIDYFAFALPLVHGFGRLGCFCAGCCYGIPYEGILAVHYTNPISSVPTDISIFPVQLIESLCLLSLSLLILFLFRKEKKHLFYIYLFSYCVIRFILEFYRFDSERGVIGPFSTSQVISIIAGVCGAIVYVFLFIRQKKLSKNAIS